MVGQGRSNRRAGGQQESVEVRRRRMRIAQRKHRARKEQTIADLEDEVITYQTRLANIQHAFNGLQHVVDHATRNGSYTSRIDLWPALDTLRAALADDQTRQQNGDDSHPESLPATRQEEVIWPPADEMLASQPGPFGMFLYEKSIKLGFRLLSSEDRPSNRLAHRLFGPYMATMEQPDSVTRMRIIRDCLGARLHSLAHTHDPRERYAMWKILGKPRVPGYHEHLNVSEVETYLRHRGFEFSNDLSQVFIRLRHESTPDLDSDNEDDSDEVEDSHDLPMWDTSPDLFGFPIHSKPSDFAKPATAFDMDEALPFGLHDQSNDEPDFMDLAGFGISGSEHLDSNMMDAVGSFPSNSNQGPLTTTTIEVNLEDLVRRLVSVSVCIGTPGPGFPPTDVGKIVEDLIACD